MWKISFRNKFFSIPMVIPITGIISSIVMKILFDLWVSGKTGFIKDCVFAFERFNFYILIINIILIFISLGFAISKTISIPEFLINLFLNILSFSVIALFVVAMGR